MRRRLLACEAAGIEPRFDKYEGDDPAGYALAVNITRRHLSKGQQAMIIVKAKSLVTKDLGSQAGLAREHACTTTFATRVWETMSPGWWPLPPSPPPRAALRCCQCGLCLLKQNVELLDLIVLGL